MCRSFGIRLRLLLRLIYSSKQEGVFMQKYQMYIGGKFVDSASGKRFDSYNPYTGEPWEQIAQGNAADDRSRDARQ